MLSLSGAASSLPSPSREGLGFIDAVLHQQSITRREKTKNLYKIHLIYDLKLKPNGT